MAYAPHTGTGGLTAAEKDTVKNWMVSGHSVQKVSGTVPDNGAVSLSVNPGESVTVPAGYHNGSGTVTAGRGKVTRKYLGQIHRNGYADNTRTTTASVTDLPGWQNFTRDNFALDFVKAGWNSSDGEPGLTSISYNNSTGVVTATFTRIPGGYDSCVLYLNLYVYYVA